MARACCVPDDPQYAADGGLVPTRAVLVALDDDVAHGGGASHDDGVEEVELAARVVDVKDLEGGAMEGDVLGAWRGQQGRRGKWEVGRG